MKRKSTSILLASCTALALLPLAGCDSLFEQPKPKHVQHKVVKSAKEAETTANAYVTNLSLARIALLTAPDDMESALSNASVVKNYNSKKKSKTETLTLAVLEYKFQNSSQSQRLLAPVNVKNGDFSSLQTLLDRAKATSGSLQNIHLVSASVSPDSSFTLPEDAASLRSALDSQQQRVLSHSHALSLVDNVKIQLTLIDFYIKNRSQDAAYLTLDNVKRELAESAQNKTLDEKTLADLSAKVDAVESTLKKELPYKL